MKNETSSPSPNWQGPQAEKIQNMFGAIAKNYDKANTVLSGGVHHLWRKKLVKWSGIGKGRSVLDCATGTGDLAIEFAKAVGPEGLVIGTDFCREMIDLAPEKARQAGVDVGFKTADVTNLPFADGQFDLSSIAFGIRNVENTRQGISELARVVKPGGTVMILEFGQPAIPGFREAYNFYSRKVLPTIGGWVTGEKEAYSYLQNSSSNFPCRGDFVELMMSTGAFASVEFTGLTGGIAYIYKGVTV